MRKEYLKILSNFWGPLYISGYTHSLVSYLENHHVVELMKGERKYLEELVSTEVLDET